MDRRAFVTGLGAVLAAPLAAEAQRAGKVFRLGVLTPGGHSTASAPTMSTALPGSLRELGYIEGQNLTIEKRFADGKLDRLPRLGPVLSKAPPLPPQDGVGSDDHEGLLPPGPDSCQPDPEEGITFAERRPGHRSFVYGELVTQGQILEGQLAVAAKEEGEKPKQVE